MQIVPDEPDQVPRLAAFRQADRAAVIVAGDGWWQARVPEPVGETVITRYTLRELLDKLASLLDGG